MQFSGEQLIPGLTSKRLLDEHLERYKFATSFSKDKTVLDIACGTGYGSMELSKNSKHVTGVDVSRDCIDYAKNNYLSNNLEYLCASATDNIFDESCFDLICSFETIEHLNEQEVGTYLSNLHKWLKPGGSLLISTPNKKVTSPYTTSPLNPYHVKEYKISEFIGELSKLFYINKVLGQRLINKFFLFKFTRKTLRLFEIIFSAKFRIYDLGSGPKVRSFNHTTHEPRIMYLICIK